MKARNLPESSAVYIPRGVSTVTTHLHANRLSHALAGHGINLESQDSIRNTLVKIQQENGCAGVLLLLTSFNYLTRSEKTRIFGNMRMKAVHHWLEPPRKWCPRPEHDPWEQHSRLFHDEAGQAVEARQEATRQAKRQKREVREARQEARRQAKRQKREVREVRQEAKRQKREAAREARQDARLMDSWAFHSMCDHEAMFEATDEQLPAHRPPACSSASWRRLPSEQA